MLGWIAFALSVIGILLNAKKIIWCWPIWLVSNVLWIIHIWTQPAPDYSALCLWVVFLMSNIYGWFQWGRDSYNTDHDLYTGYKSEEDDYDAPGWQGHWNRKDGF